MGNQPGRLEGAAQAQVAWEGANYKMNVDDPGFWFAVLQIIWIDVLLSGDNAVVIALACRKLPPQQRLWGIVLGTIVAISLRVIFAGAITTLMHERQTLTHSRQLHS